MPKRNRGAWVFLNIGGRCLLEGVRLGYLYGLIYGTIYGCFVSGGTVIGLPYGLFVGTLSGIILGLIDAFALGTFSVLWSRSQVRLKTQDNAGSNAGYRWGFILIGLLITTVGGLFVIARVDRWILYSVDSFDIWLDIVPSLIAGLAAFQASQKVIPWFEENVGRGAKSVTAEVI